VPAGLDAQGLPVGLQLVARPGEDRLALRVAQLFQERTSFHLLRPGRVAA
jgi:Asp-tRNA(Asn)/Glu-tRNA(Gln) amidotransferase A subunit family amidase